MVVFQLQFLWETSLTSKSFDTLDNLLGFQVQKLLTENNKISIINPLIKYSLCTSDRNQHA